jgi:hypothetical protein
VQFFSRRVLRWLPVNHRSTQLETTAVGSGVRGHRRAPAQVTSSAVTDTTTLATISPRPTTFGERR